jgi:mono/diheme cytochrome c family protein
LSKSSSLVTFACIAATILLGASQALAISPGSTAAGADANALPQALEEIMKDPEHLPKAETMFYQNCAYCHGSQGSGGKARPLQCRPLTPEYLFDTITNGRRRGANIMPPWKDSMAETERWKLVAYIMTLRDLPLCEKK